MLGLLLCCATAGALTCQSPPRFQRFKLVAPGSGWVVAEPSDGSSCPPHRLYWTDDNGRSWRDITPRPMPTPGIGLVFFLDRSHGWTLSSDSTGADAEGVHFFLLRTEDGGKNWGTTVLQSPTLGMPDSYDSPIQLQFTDSQHGWMLWHWHLMNSSHDHLLSTSDGGRSWKRLPDPPGAGPLQFLSPNDGWMIGGSPGQTGIPRIDNDQLWRTHDGGKNWKPVSVPAPHESAYWFDRLNFWSVREGVVTGQEQISPRQFRFSTCRTEDEGKSWHCEQFEAYGADPFFAGTHVYWRTIDHVETTNRGVRLSKPRLQVDGRTISTAVPAAESEDGIGTADFVDPSNGWILYGRGRHEIILTTTDGGKSAQPASMPAWPGPGR